MALITRRITVVLAAACCLALTVIIGGLGLLAAMWGGTHGQPDPDKRWLTPFILVGGAMIVTSLIATVSVTRYPLASTLLFAGVAATAFLVDIHDLAELFRWFGVGAAVLAGASTVSSGPDYGGRESERRFDSISAEVGLLIRDIRDAERQQSEDASSSAGGDRS